MGYREPPSLLSYPQLHGEKLSSRLQPSRRHLSGLRMLAASMVPAICGHALILCPAVRLRIFYALSNWQRSLKAMRLRVHHCGVHTMTLNVGSTICHQVVGTRFTTTLDAHSRWSTLSPTARAAAKLMQHADSLAGVLPCFRAQQPSRMSNVETMSCQKGLRARMRARASMEVSRSPTPASCGTCSSIQCQVRASYSPHLCRILSSQSKRAMPMHLIVNA